MKSLIPPIPQLIIFKVAFKVRNVLLVCLFIVMLHFSRVMWRKVDLQICARRRRSTTKLVTITTMTLKFSMTSCCWAYKLQQRSRESVRAGRSVYKINFHVFSLCNRCPATSSLSQECTTRQLANVRSQKQRNFVTLRWFISVHKRVVRIVYYSFFNYSM